MYKGADLMSLESLNISDLLGGSFLLFALTS